MHYLLLITLTMPLASTSLEVRQQVYQRLLSDASFCGDGGRFHSPRCDWFVIGGRWSGHLSKARLKIGYQQALEIECSTRACKPLYTDDDKQREGERLNDVWRRFGGLSESPYLRNSYEDLGYADDAAIVDRAIYDNLLAEYAGESRSEDLHFADLDEDPVDESFVDRKWIVVVDYHN